MKASTIALALALALSSTPAVAVWRGGGGGEAFTGGTLSEQLILDATNTLCSQALSLCMEDDTDTGLQRAAADILIWCTGGAERLRISTTAITAALPVTSTVASGSNAFGVGTNGARIDFGTGANDHASSDGSTVTFAATIAAFQYVNTSQWVRTDTFLASSSVNLTVSAATAPTATNQRISSTGAVGWTPASPNGGASGSLLHACNVDAESDVITMTDGSTYEGNGCILGINDCVTAQWDSVSSKWRQHSCSDN